MSNIEKWREKSAPSSLFGSWDNFHREFNRMFQDMDQALTTMRPSSLMAGEEFLSPACDVAETDSQYVLAFDLPGVRKEDITIEASGNQLVIEGERRREEEHKGKYFQIERSYGKFRRVFTLPQEADAEKVEANFTSGVLRIAIPKSQTTPSRKITIGDKKPSIIDKLTGKTQGEEKSGVHH